MFRKKLIKVHYNIEFAHIYVNENITREHFEGSWIVKRLINDMKKKNESFSTSILIDDYNPTDNLLNVTTFIKQVEEHGVVPDYFVHESDLIRYKDYVLMDINDERLKKSYTRYIAKNNNVPCSFLVAIWNLLRLGELEIYSGILHNVKEKPNPFIADKIISVLPKRYEAVEDKALEIIKKSPYKKAAQKISHVFF